MNIIEAIKSGKRYRRKGETGWYDATDHYQDYVFPTRAVLADDWEVEEVRVTITREQFDAAWKSVTEYIDITQPFFRTNMAHAMLCEKLGL
jgi:hypothetical protein